MISLEKEKNLQLFFHKRGDLSTQHDERDGISVRKEGWNCSLLCGQLTQTPSTHLTLLVSNELVAASSEQWDIWSPTTGFPPAPIPVEELCLGSDGLGLCPQELGALGNNIPALFQSLTCRMG